MMKLPETYAAVVELLELLRCDHCGTALHQPFTTSVCEHLLCPSCNPGNANNKQSICPVCKVPVHPRDCMLHAPTASLVLTARRLKKITLGACDESSKDADHTVVEVDEASVKSEQPTLTDEPRVTVKRAYSSRSSNKTLPLANTSIVTLKRGYSSSNKMNCPSETGSLNSQALTCQSFSSTNSIQSVVSVTLKPALCKRSNIKTSLSNKITKLPAYPTTKGHTLPRDLSKSTSVTDATVSCIELPPQIPLIDVKQSDDEQISKENLNSTLTNIPTTRQTRQSLKNMQPFNSPTVLAPIASPEQSCMTDLSHKSMPHDTRKTSIVLTPIKLSDDDDSSIKLSTSMTSKKSVKRNHTKKDRDSDIQSRKGLGQGISSLFNKLRPNSKGESLLHRAAIRGDLKTLKQLLTSEISPNVRDHAGWTPLHEAALRGYCEIVETLLNAGASVDIPGGPDLETPLHEAVQNCHVSVCKLLLDRDADPTVPNGAGFTPLQQLEILISKMKSTSPKSKRRSSSSNIKHNNLQTSLYEIRDLLQSALQKKSLFVSKPTAASTAPVFSIVERRRLRPVLLGTGLTRNQQSLFARVANMIHARVVSNISPEVTHVVTGALQDSSAQKSNLNRKRSSPPSGLDEAQAKSSTNQATCPRTLKFLHAILQGCWILSFDWIETCAHVKMRVEEEGFEVTGCSTAPDSGAPRRARLAKEAGLLGLFHGMRLCLLGDFVYPVPSRDELISLARSGGATVVFARQRCSPVHLARLSISTCDPNNACSWELDTEAMKNLVDNDDTTDPDSSMIQDSGPSLLVLFDPRPSSNPTSHTRDDPTHPTQIVSKALQLLKPSGQVHSAISDPPLRAVPCTWMLDSAAEFRLLPYSAATKS